MCKLINLKAKAADVTLTSTAGSIINETIVNTTTVIQTGNQLVNDMEVEDVKPFQIDMNFGVPGLSEELADTASGAVEPVVTTVDDKLDDIHKNSVVGPIANGLSRDIPKVLNSSLTEDIPIALEGGLDGYRDVKDNAPLIPRIMLKVGMTAVEIGLTGNLKGTQEMAYDFASGMLLDTQPLNVPGMVGQMVTDEYKEKTINER